MASRLAASILVRLVDQASGPAGKIAKALRGISSVTRGMGGKKDGFKVDASSVKNLQRLSQAAKRASADLKGLDGRKVRISAADVRSFRAASTAARRLTSDLKDAAAAARSVRVNLNGSGLRGSPFRAMRRDIQGALADMQRLNSLSARVGRGRGGYGGGGSGYGGGGGQHGSGRGRRGRGYAEDYVAIRAAEGTVHGARRVASFAGKAGANSMREDARDYLAGLTQADTERLHKTSTDLSSKYRSVDQTTLHEMLRDTSMSMGSVDKGVENGDTLARMAVVLQSMKGPEKAIENVRQFYSALDVLGKNVDPATVKKLANAYTKAQGVEGAEMDMGKLLQVARQSRSAGGSLDDDFLMYAVPSLMQDLGAPQTGTALASGLSQVIGGRATKESLGAQAAFGLRKGKGGDMTKEDRDMFMGNLDTYAREKLMPALAKGATVPIMKRNKVVGHKNVAPIDFEKGDPNDVEKQVNSALSNLYSNRVVADIFGKLINQREQYARKRQQYKASPGDDAADKLNTKDPYVANKGVASQATNVAAEALRPYMDTYTKAADKLSEVLGNLAKSMADNPNESKIATPIVTGVVGTIAAWLAGRGLQEVAANSTGIVGTAARVAGTGLVGAAGGAAAVPLVAGTVGGALLDNNVSAIGGKDTLESWNKALERRKAAEIGDMVLGNAKGFGAFDKNKKMGTIGSALDSYKTDYSQSRGSVVKDFLFGAERGTLNLPTFGFQTRDTSAPKQLPGEQAPFVPPRRPESLGGTAPPLDSAAGTGLPAPTAKTEAISAATAEVAKYTSELDKAKEILEQLKASSDTVFSPATFNQEAKVQGLEQELEKTKSKLEDLGKVEAAPKVDTAPLTQLDSATDQTRGKLDQLGSVSVAPKVDPSSISSAIGVVDQLLSKLAQVGSAADGAAARVSSAAATATAGASAASRALASMDRSKQTSNVASPT